MSSTPPPEKATVEGLADRLRESILSGELATGTWLRQERLAEQYGTSRTPVREALRALQAQRLVEVVPHRGALVCGPTLRDIHEAYAVRAELEGFAAELAANLARDAEIERLHEAEELFRHAVEATPAGDDQASGRPRWSEANDLFHEVILSAAGNRRLAETIDTLHQSFPRNVTWGALSGSSHLLQENVAQHREIARAIAAHDPALARDAMKKHVQRSGELIAMRFEQLQPRT
ncbi:MAG TPA: GntR family transcriptional regulator [Baekduia sp.]